MSKILVNIDGRDVEAGEGTTVLEVAQSIGIEIPTLCQHDLLEPYGACRLCTVEADTRDSQGRVSTRLVASCLYPVEKGLVAVRTRSEKIDRIRKMILQLLLAHAPNSRDLNHWGNVYGADKNLFEKEPSFCINCGLCVRYCAEVKQKNAVGFVSRGTTREISFVPELVAKECGSCKECFPLCPTEALQAAYVLAEALASFSATLSF